MIIDIKWLRKRADRAWECAGLARQDGDSKDEARWTEEARRLEAELAELIRASR